MLGLAVSAALPALAAAPNAAARPPILDSDPVGEATARASSYWGGTPCGGVVTVTAASDSEAPVTGANAPNPSGSSAAMWATWVTPLGINVFGAPTTFSSCVVHVNARVWPNWLADDRGFTAFCKEMVHEFGHFAGYPDAGAAPRTIQYEQPDLATVPVCESYRLIYAHKTFIGRITRKHRSHRRSPAR